jgi:hypothetical protein
VSVVYCNSVCAENQLSYFVLVSYGNHTLSSLISYSLCRLSPLFLKIFLIFLPLETHLTPLSAPPHRIVLNMDVTLQLVCTVIPLLLSYTTVWA